MIVLDTSILLAFHNTRDIHHAEAVEAMQRFSSGTWGKGLLLEYVFLETVSRLKATAGPVVAIQSGSILRRAHQLEWVPSSDQFLRCWTEFQSNYLTPLDFVDHAVVIAARERAGGKILAVDPVFCGIAGVAVYPASESTPTSVSSRER